jgi:hypothetical protein
VGAWTTTIWLRLYQRDNGEYVAIGTDLDDGPSITNAAEELATAVRLRFLKTGDVLHWYEHYAERKATKETLELVTFSYDGLGYRDPEWKHTQRSALETLLGTTIEAINPP